MTAYREDPLDPEAPVRLLFYNGLTVGDRVTYEGAIPMAGEHVISELWIFVDMHDGDDLVQAVLDDGALEVDADNLRKVPDA